MNRNDIVALPHPNLREKSHKISSFDQDLKQFVDEMRHASLDWEDHREHEFCVGLAAIQVDHLKRVVILRDDLDDKSNRNFSALINPKLIKAYGEIEYAHEGCLSVKDIYVKIPRYTKVKVKAQDENGAEFRITAEGFLARVLQHEIDHTNGILIVDHAKNDPEAFFKINQDGKTTPLNYDKDIKDNPILWD